MMKHLLLSLLLLAAPVWADLRFEDFRRNYSNDDDALAAAITAAKTGVGSCVIRWMGQLTLRREPPPLDRVHLWGDDIYGATVLKQYPGGVLFRFDGRPGFSGGGLHNFSVIGTPELAGSYIILARGNANYGPHGLQLENLYLGAGAFRAIEIIGYGSLGARQIRMTNITCFLTQAQPAVVLVNTVECRIETLSAEPQGNSVMADPSTNPRLIRVP